LPIDGGFYLSFFPDWFIKHAIKKINKLNQPAICYLHPCELDPKIPELKSLSWNYYWGLSKTESRFKKLPTDFKFTSIRKAFGLE